MNHLPQTVLIAARAKSLRLATAESCTGGLIAGALTDIAGSSDVFDRGFVTYSNEAKRDMLGVPWPLLLAKGAVSAEVAKAMAAGALARSDADIAVAVTGIAGPGGGTADKPVGLVYFGVASAHGVRFERRVFPKGSRAFVRTKTVEMVLRLFLAEIGA